MKTFYLCARCPACYAREGRHCTGIAPGDCHERRKKAAYRILCQDPAYLKALRTDPGTFRARVFNLGYGNLKVGWRGPPEGKDDAPATLDGWLWPYGPPEAHEDTCRLWDGDPGCDCGASVAEEP